MAHCFLKAAIQGLPQAQIGLDHAGS